MAVVLRPPDHRPLPRLAGLAADPDHEDAAEREHRAVRGGRVGLAHPGPVLVKELRRLVRLQHGEHRAQPGPLVPVENRVLGVPPGRRNLPPRATTVRWPGTHCSTALETITSTRPPGRQSLTSPRAKLSRRP